VATMIDLDDVQPRSEDPDELGFLLRQLIGKPFLFFRESYGEELTLHLGERISYNNPRMAKNHRGSYLIAARASAWFLASGANEGIYYTSDNLISRKATGPVRYLELSEIEKREIATPGSVVVNIAAIPSGLTGFVLNVTLSDKTGFLILPIEGTINESDTTDVDDEMQLSDWEIYMPRHRVLKAGPGQYWSYLDTRTKLSEEAN
jgi:hypothetical protein